MPKVYLSLLGNTENDKNQKDECRVSREVPADQHSKLYITTGRSDALVSYDINSFCLFRNPPGHGSPNIAQQK